MGKIYVGAPGTEVILDVGLDVSAAAARRIYYRKPQTGDEGFWTAEAVADGEGNEGYALSYTTTADDGLDEAGEWLLYPWIDIETWSGPGPTVRQDIYAVFD